jgi:hypothetical protein
MVAPLSNHDHEETRAGGEPVAGGRTAPTWREKVRHSVKWSMKQLAAGLVAGAAAAVLAGLWKLAELIVHLFF